MATDPLQALNSINPLGRQRTQPTPTEARQDDGMDRFDRAVAAVDEQRKREEIRRLQETPADQQRRAQVARDLGLKPSEIVDLGRAERALQAQRQMKLREKYPAIGRAFNQNPPLAGYMLGQEDELSTLGNIWDGLKKAPGRLIETGGLGLASMMTSTLALASEVGAVPTALQPAINIGAQPARRIIEAERTASRERYSSDNFVVEGVLAGLESVPLTLGAVVLRNPYAAAGAIGLGVGSESVYEGRERGLSKGASLLYGAAQGVPEAAFELLPMGELLKVGGRGFLSGFGRYMLAEVPGEILTTTAQSFTDWAVLPENKDRTFKDWALGLPEEYAQTVLGVIGGGTVTVTTAKGVEAIGRFAQRREAQRQMAAVGKFEGDFLDRLGGQLAGNSLRQEDPEAFASLMRDFAQDRGVSTVLVPGEAVRDYLQSSAFEGENDPLAPYQQAALEAAAAGNDIALPIETALTVLPGSKAWEALKDDMRLTAGGMSRRQAEALEASEEAMLEEFRKQAEETDTKAKKQTASREARIAKIKTKLEEDGGFAPAEAERQAELLVARMTTRAARMGRDDQAVDNAVENLRIRQVMPPELQRAMAAQEQDMVVAILRGNTKGSTGRARAAAAELQAVLARQGWTPEQLSDEQLGQVIDRLRAAGENDGREYRAGRGSSGGADGKYAPLDGATKARGWHGPVRELVDAAEEYARRAGIDLKRQAYFITKERFDVEFATRIAEAYEAMEHAPNDPAVRAAYEAMIAETRAQYDVLVEFGYSFTFFGNDDDPYAGNPFNAMRDLRDNKTMAVYSTIAGHGSGYSDTAVDDNPLLADTGLEWPDQNGQPVKVLANDLFRAVHDAFGHGLEGAGFRYDGEENAWQAHARLFSPAALPALTSETRGQNSWLNFGPRGDENRFAVLDDTTFADQKAGLLPSWAWTENVVPDMERDYEQDAAERLGERGDVSGIRDVSVDARASYPRLERPPVNEDGTVTLDHFTDQEGLTQTDPSAWGRSGRFLPDEERTRIGKAPGRTYFGIATQRGGYVNEFSSGLHPRSRKPIYRVTARIPFDRLYDMYGDPDGLKAVGRALPKDERGRYIYKGKAIDGVSLYERLIQDAGYAGYWTPALGLTAAVFEPVDLQPYVPERDDYQPEGMRSLEQSALPTLRAAIRHKGKVYSSVGDHLAALSQIPDEAERAAARMDGDNRGFVTERGRFLDRFRAQEYAVANGLISPNAPAWARTSPDLISENLMRYDEQIGQGRVQDTISDLAGWTPERIRNLLSQYAVSHEPNLTKSYVAHVTPQQFLDVTTPRGEYQDRVRDEAGELDEERLASEVQTPFLMVDVSGDGIFQVIGHEGRHRMAALARAGIERVPVVIKQIGIGWSPLPERNRTTVLLRQRHSDTLRGEKNIILNRMVPLTYDNRAQIEQEFGQGRVLFQQRQFEQATWFYSALERAAESVKTERAPAAQWIATLKNAPGVKAEQLKWTGIIDWLEAQTGPVDKSQVIETIQRGGIVIREIGRGAWPADPEAIAEYERQMEEYEEKKSEIEATLDERIERLEREFEDEFSEQGYDTGYYVEEVTEDEDGEPLDTPKYRINNEYYTPDSELYDDEDAAYEDMWENYSGPAESEALREALREQNFRDKAEREIEDEIEDLEEPDDPRDGTPTRWYNFSLAKRVAGGIDTYFEWLLTLPPGVGGNPEDVFREGHWGDEGEGVVVHVRGHERTGAGGKRILFLDEIQSQWHKEARDRFKVVMRMAVEELYGRIGYQPQETLGEPFSKFPRDLLEQIRDSINGGPVRPHEHWKTVASWLEANPSNFGNELLAKVSGSNRGYRAPVDPQKIAEAEATLEAARNEFDAKMSDLSQAIVAFGDKYGIKIEGGALSTSFPDSNVRFLRGKLEDKARTEWVALGLMRGEPDVSPKALATQARRTYEIHADLSTLILATNDRITAGFFDDFNEVANLVAELEGRPVGEVAGDFAGESEKPGGGLALKALFDASNNAMSDVRLRTAELSNAKDARGIPDAPFRDTWYLVAMKRMIAKAAAEGYDQIAWIKQGENNGGMDDEFDWLYGRVLPNEVNKLLKPYKAKTKPLYVDGLEPAETPERKAFEAIGQKLNSAGVSWNTGITEERFRGNLAVAVEDNRRNIKRLTSMLDLMQYEDRIKQLEEEIEYLSDADARWQEFDAAREAYVPGYATLEQRDDALKAEAENIAPLAGPFKDAPSFARDEETARRTYDRARTLLEDDVDTAKRQLSVAEQVVAKTREALDRGDTEVTVDGIEEPFTPSENVANAYASTIERKRQTLREKAAELALYPSFEEALAKGRRLAEIADERAALSRERVKIMELPTNLGFDITPELREAAASGFPLFQPDHRNMPRGRILFPGNDDQGAEIELFQGRDLSTLIHESSHLWLEELKADAADPNAPEQIKRDWQTVLDWFKANGHEVRDGIIPVGAHEMWARGGERYMREGKAPSVGLKRAFETFRSWLVSLYKTVRGLNSPITPEIREVFDRLLATDDEIAEARQMQGMDALFNTAVEAGMSPDEFANYQEQVASARAEAQGKVIEKVMADIAKRETRLGRERRRQIKDQVTKAAEDVPLFKALAVLREERMDRAALVERFGEDVVGQLPSRVPPLYAEGGTDPEIIAEMAGFASAEDMVNAMIAAEADQKAAKAGGDKRNMKARFIDQMTDQAFAAQYGEPMSPEQMMAEAQDAVANERQGEVIASEIAALSRRVGKQATPYQMARQWARTRVRQGVYVAEASKQALERHRRAIAAAGREAEQALLAGDMEAVYRAKQKQMLSSALLSEAKAAHEEVEVARARMERIAKARTMKSVDQDYLEQAHALLEEVELKQRSQKSIDEFEARFDRWSAWSQQRAAEGHDVVVPETFLARIGNTNWSRLPVEQLLGLDAAVKQVIHFGRLKQTLLDNKERRDYEAVKAEIKAVAREVGKKPPKSDFAEPGWWDSLKGKVASLDAALLKAETIFDWLDNGNPNGVFNRYVFRPIARAAARESDMLRDFYARHKANLEAIPKATLKTWAQKINTGWMERKTGQPLVLSRQQVIAMALNWGNAGNRQRLTDGYGLSEIAVENFLMKTLTAEEWAFVQSTWDLIGELWPEIAAMERRVNGVEPEKVEAISFNTPHGPMRGGYYPAIYNTVIDRKAQRHAEESEDLFSAKTTKATTRASSTKERAETVKRPILLDLGVITRHMGEVIHDITHREAVIQAHKLLTDPEVLDEIDAVLGREYSEQLRPWVKYVANRWAHERSGNEGFARFFSKLRANATVVGMGFRFTTMAVQIAGYSNSIEYVGAAPMAEAIAKFSASPVETTRFVREKSGEMRNRFDNLDRDINQEIRRAAMPGVKGGTIKTVTAAKTFAFHGIGYMDMVVSVPTWLAGYNKALARGATEEQAIYEGDKSVRLSQGSGDAKDLAAVQRGTGPWGEALKLMTMFYSYMSAFYQRQRRLGRDVARAGISDVPGLMARAWWLLVVPPILSELLAGRGPDDDEDPAWWGFQKIISQMLGPIPLVRDLWGPITDRFQGEPSYGYRFTPIQGVGESAVNVAGDLGNIAEGDETRRMTRNVLELIGFSTGLVPGQIAASTQFLVDVGYGDQDPQTAGEWFEGLTKGKIEED